MDMDKCEVYSVEEDKWKAISKMLKKKNNVSACIFNSECIFVIGGFRNGKSLNDIDKYDIFNN